MAAEREDIIRMALGSNPDEEENSYGCHQLNQREISFGHDEESERESLEMGFRFKQQPSQNSSNFQ
jgi:hypothetical protein